MVVSRRIGDRIVPDAISVVLLTTRARKTGRERTVLLESCPTSRGVVVVAVNSGQQIDPDWYRTLAPPGGGVTVRGGKRRHVCAEALSDGEAEASWPDIETQETSFGRVHRTMWPGLPPVRLVLPTPD